MSRPKFPNMILPVSAIRAIREAQEAYDRDPEAYERKEEQRREDLEREAQEEMERVYYEEMEYARRS